MKPCRAGEGQANLMSITVKKSKNVSPRPHPTEASPRGTAQIEMGKEPMTFQKLTEDRISRACCLQTFQKNVSD